MAKEKRKKRKREERKEKGRNPSQVWKLYQIEGNKVQRPKYCPRCGKATIMAEHEDRWHCGHCGYTLFKKK